jgi:hypothetical protein
MVVKSIKGDIMAKRAMPKKFVEPVVEPAELEEEVSKNVAVFGCKVLNVRESPNEKSKVLFTIPFDTRLVVEKASDKWLHVIAVDGRPKKGFILREFTKEI